MNKYEKTILNTFEKKVNEALKEGLDNKMVGSFIIGFAGGYDSAIDDFKAEISQEFLEAIYEYGNRIAFLYDEEDS